MNNKACAMMRWQKACVKMADIGKKYSALQTQYYEVVILGIEVDTNDIRAFRKELQSEITSVSREFWAAKAIVAGMHSQIEKLFGPVNSL